MCVFPSGFGLCPSFVGREDAGVRASKKERRELSVAKMLSEGARETGY